MKILAFLNQRIKRFSIFDEKLAQAAAMFLAFMLVKWFPGIIDANIWWFVAGLVICAIKPLYVFYLKKK